MASTGNTKQYRTKQKELILSCIQAHQGAFFTSKDITSALADQGTKVGTATVYRNLERLEEEGIIARGAEYSDELVGDADFVIFGLYPTALLECTSSICYRFLPDAPEDVYFFLKCEECGNLSPIDCGELQKLYEHVIEHHHVRINPTKTVLYGLCEACLAKRGE